MAYCTVYNRQPTEQEKVVLRRIAATLGKTWKAQVRRAWMRGHYLDLGIDADDSWVLQMVRNTMSADAFSKLKI
jgi:hypothetical protein